MISDKILIINNVLLPDILPQHMRISVPTPIADLYTFYGRLEIPSRDGLVLSTDHLMLRGSRVKNTEWAIGCAVYTGQYPLTIILVAS